MPIHINPPIEPNYELKQKKELEAMEKEANEIAFELLMPEAEFKRVWKMGLSIEEVAKRFGVPESVATVRGMQVMGEFMP